MLEVVFSDVKPAGGMVKIVPMVEKNTVTVEFLTTEEIKLLQKAVEQSGFDGKFNEKIDVFGGRSRISLFGLGEAKDDLAVQQAGEALFDVISEEEAVYIATENEAMALNLAYGVLLGSYRFDKYKTSKKADDFAKLEQIVLRVEDAAKATEAFKPYLALVTAMRYAKDLCNEPASYLTPEVFAADIKRLSYLGLDVEILDEEAIRVKGLGLIDAVAKGSKQSPRVAIISWKGNRHQETYDLGLAGKGVCFDSGGLSLKSNAGMVEMKMDMAGAAAVVAVMKAAALQRVRKNVVAIVGLVENMPGCGAMKIGDIYTAVNGKTVEVMNTDAEGRMVLADCLAYLQANYLVKKVVDLATLGSLRTVLGNVYAGMFANDDKLVKILLKAGEVSGEKLWQMPLDADYRKMLNSPLADMRNIASDSKASITSAAFLAEFIEKGVRWAHIDMSGMRLDKIGLASGFGVKLLNEVIKGL